MSDDILKMLGLTPEDDDHPADVTTLNKLGLKPETDEKPPRAPMIGDRALAPWETTPNANPPPGTVNTQPTSTLGRIHAAINPATVLSATASDIGSNIGDYASAGASQFSRGMGQIFQVDENGKYAGQPASGLGNAAMGAASMPMSLITGPVRSGQDLLDKIIPSPEPGVPRYLTGSPTGEPAPYMANFGERAALMVPFRVGSPAASAVTTKVAPSTKAFNAIAERMTPEAIARMQANPRLRPMDVSQGVRNIAVGFAKDTSNPEAMAPLVTSMQNSAATAKNAVRGTYDETMGPPPNVYEELERLKAQAQTVGRSKIQPALDAAKPVDTSGVIEAMDKVLKPGVQSVASPGVPFRTRLQSELQEWRQELEDSGSVLTDPNRLHEIQSDMRRYAEDLQKSQGPDKRVGRQLMDFRNQLVDAIDAAGPKVPDPADPTKQIGAYKAGLAEYKDAKDVSAAFDFGRTATRNGTDVEDDPSYWNHWFEDPKKSPEEIAAARLGVRQAAEHKMGSIKSSALDPARSGTDIPQVDFNKRKIQAAFGKDDTERMFRHLLDERDIAVTNTRGLANSTTAEAQAAQQAFKPREVTQPHSNLPGWALSLGLGAGALTSPTLGAITGGSLLALRGAKSGYDWIGRQSDLARNARMSDIMTRNDPQTIAKLTAAMDRVSRRNKLSNLLAPP